MHERKLHKRIIALCVAVIMAFSILPVTAMADETDVTYTESEGGELPFEELDDTPISGFSDTPNLLWSLTDWLAGSGAVAGIPKEGDSIVAARTGGGIRITFQDWVEAGWGCGIKLHDFAAVSSYYNVGNYLIVTGAVVSTNIAPGSPVSVGIDNGWNHDGRPSHDVGVVGNFEFIVPFDDIGGEGDYRVSVRAPYPNTTSVSGVTIDILNLEIYDAFPGPPPEFADDSFAITATAGTNYNRTIYRLQPEPAEEVPGEFLMDSGSPVITRVGVDDRGFLVDNRVNDYDAVDINPETTGLAIGDEIVVTGRVMSNFAGNMTFASDLQAGATGNQYPQWGQVAPDANGVFTLRYVMQDNYQDNRILTEDGANVRITAGAGHPFIVDDILISRIQAALSQADVDSLLANAHDAVGNALVYIKNWDTTEQDILDTVNAILSSPPFSGFVVVTSEDVEITTGNIGEPNTVSGTITLGLAHGVELEPAVVVTPWVINADGYIFLNAMPTDPESILADAHTRVMNAINTATSLYSFTNETEDSEVVSTLTTVAEFVLTSAIYDDITIDMQVYDRTDADYENDGSIEVIIATVYAGDNPPDPAFLDDFYLYTIPKLEPEPDEPDDFDGWELDITPELAAALTAGTNTYDNLDRASDGETVYTYDNGNIVVSNRNASWNSIDVRVDGLNLLDGVTYKLTVYGQGTANQLQLHFPLDNAPWETDVVTGENGVVSLNFTTEMPSVGGVTVTPPRIRIRTNGTDDFTITGAKIEVAGADTNVDPCGNTPCTCCNRCGATNNPGDKCTCEGETISGIGGGGSSRGGGGGGLLGMLLTSGNQNINRPTTQPAVPPVVIAPTVPTVATATTEATEDGVAVTVTLTEGDTVVASAAEAVSVSVAIDVDGKDHNKFVAVDATGKPVSGSYNPATGEFTFKTATAGEFKIIYVETLKRISLTIGSPILNDLAGNVPTQTMDVPPTIVNGRTLLPVRFIATALGADVAWNEATREVTITRDGVPLTFGVDGFVSPTLAAMGMDVPAQIIDGRTMVPLRFICEYFNASVSWDDVTRTVEIISL
ncbi:MAG: copper amine oxidase N-terminal domain-containing protein [Defluviitaleaceae bacterium]|nr:copper amine oxidase N-terminal domain-containing protein [Defluviitaleaceae bacterium]